MAVGLNVNSLVNVSTVWQTSGVGVRNFGALLIVGRAGVLSDTETTREYTSISAVEADFAQTTCEYQAAQAFFAQSPQPAVVYIGAWQTSETPQQCVNRLRTATMAWYAIFFAVDGSTNSPFLTPTQIANVSNYIEASNIPSLFLVNTQDDTVASGSTTDTASTSPGNSRTIWQYSGSSPYAVCSLFGIFATVQYSGNNTIRTAAYTTLPTITADDLTTAQAQYLTGKDVNYYAMYNTGAAFVMPSVTASGQDISSIIGIDAFVNDAQVSLTNYLSGRNGVIVPYDNKGISMLQAQLAKVGEQYVTNGLFAKGKTWTFDDVGSLKKGSILKTGYYFYFQPLSSVTAEQIQSGQAPLCQACVNLSGVIKSMTIDLYIGLGG